MQRLKKFGEKYSKKKLDASKSSIHPQTNEGSNFEYDSSLLEQKVGTISINDFDRNLDLNGIKEKSNSQFLKVSDSLSKEHNTTMDPKKPISKVILELPKRNDTSTSVEIKNSLKVNGKRNANYSDDVQKLESLVMSGKVNSKNDTNHQISGSDDGSNNQISGSTDGSISEEFSFRSNDMDTNSFKDGGLENITHQYVNSDIQDTNISTNFESKTKNNSKNTYKPIHNMKTTKGNNVTQRSSSEIEDEFEKYSQQLEIDAKHQDSLSLQEINDKNSRLGMFNIFTFEDLIAANDTATRREEANSTEESDSNKQISVSAHKSIEDSLLKSEDEINEEIDEVLHSQSVLHVDDDDDDNASVKTNSSYEEMMNEFSSDNKIESIPSMNKDDNGNNKMIENYVTDNTENRIEESIGVLSSKSENSVHIISEGNEERENSDHIVSEGNEERENSDHIVSVGNEQAGKDGSQEFYPSFNSDLGSIDNKQDYPVLNIKLPPSFKSKPKYKIIITKTESDLSVLGSHISSAFVESTKTEALESNMVHKSQMIEETNKSNSKFDIVRKSDSISEENNNDSTSISVQSSMLKDDEKSETKSNNTSVHSEMLDNPIAKKEKFLNDVKSTQFCNIGVQTENMNFTTDFTLNNMSSFLQTGTLLVDSLPLYRTVKFEATSTSSEFVFNEILRHQIELTRHFINSQQKIIFEETAEEVVMKRLRRSQRKSKDIGNIQCRKNLQLSGYFRVL
ncbi:hypothetical protein C0J52_04868 [Blattella germanica]|nr:hypothetical protein C0J52_04868 [Blattella germanica]